MMNATEGQGDDDNFSDPGYGGSMSEAHFFTQRKNKLCLQRYQGNNFDFNTYCRSDGTTTIDTTTLSYPYEYGRRYHAYMAEKRYGLPNDQAQQDRLLRHHDLIKTRLGGKLILAPIQSNPQRMVDLGTGIGLWAMEMADQYPSAEVIGLDLSPPELGEEFHNEFDPSNVRYVLDDFEKDWLDTDLDLVFGRFLAGSVEDWPRLMKQSFDNLKPGGWAEFQDWDTMLYSTALSQEDFEESELWKFHRDTIDLQESRGRNMRPGPELERWIREAGFVNVHAKKYRLLLGPWDKSTNLERKVGAKNLYQMLEDISGLGMTLVWGNKASIEEVELRLVDVRKDMADFTKFKAQYDYFVVYGQKLTIPTY